MESFHVIHIKGRISGIKVLEMWKTRWKCAQVVNIRMKSKKPEKKRCA